MNYFKLPFISSFFSLTKRTYVLIICLLATLAPRPGYTRQLTHDHVNTELGKFASDYIQCLLKGNPAILERYLSDSTRLMPEFQLTVIGGKNAKQYYSSFLNRFQVLSYERKPLEAIDLGSMISTLCTFEMTLKLKASQKEYTLSGKCQELLRKLPTGKLMLETQAWNYVKETTIADQLRFTVVPSVNVALIAHLPINSNITFELAALNVLQERIITNHEAGLWKEFFTDDAKYIYSNSPMYSGKTEIAAFLTEHVKHIPIFEKLDIRNDRISHLGNYVIEYASHIAIVRNGSFSGVFTGKNLNIWRREKDGSLKIFREIAMYD